MVIYIIVGAILEWLILYLVFNLAVVTLNETATRYRVVGMSVCCGLITIGISYLTQPKLWEIVIYIVVVLCSSICAFYPKKLHKSILLALVVGAYILLGLGIEFLLQILYFNLFKITYKSFLIFDILKNFILLILGAIVFCLFKIVYQRRVILDFVYDLTIYVDNYKFTFKMFLDSGNMLYDVMGTGLPVVLISYKALQKKYCKEIAYMVSRTIKCSGVGGSTELFVLEPQKIELATKEGCREISAVVGLIDMDFKNYDGLLHPSVCRRFYV